MVAAYLDDSLHARRATMPMGGNFSVRFPGAFPDALMHGVPSTEFPNPGADLIEHQIGTAAVIPAGVDANQGGRTTNNDIRKMKVPELRSALAALGLATSGVKAALVERLLGHQRNTGVGMIDDDVAQDVAMLPTAAPASDVEPALAAAEIRKMKVDELKAALAQRHLSTMGFKADLVERLLDAVAGTEAVGSSDSEAASTTEWKVKKIIGRRSTIKTVQGHLFEIMEFQVQWDFPDHDDPTADEVTWEPLSNLENAHEALHDFLASQPKQPSCKYGHMLGTCRCQRPLIHSGQDESIFKAYQKSSYQWVVGGVRGLRKKTDGPGEMVSGFKDELRGFGHPLTEDELLVVNCYREALGKQPLKGSPGVRFLQYGKNKEGYWTFDHFAEQVSDVLDMYEAIYPAAQVLIEVDWSSGHSKMRADALHVGSMSVNLGGKQSVPHSSKMVDGCLGEGSQLQVGDVQYFYYRSADERGDGKPDPPPFDKPTLQPAEYVGKAKGMKQVAWERGLWKPGMVHRISEDDAQGRDQSLSLESVLSRCTDFRTETTALQAMIESRGHILAMSPKGHCELAGNGIEYDWGRMKQHFRRTNKLVKFHELILSSMSREVLPLSTSRKFARKARSYRRAYREGVDNEHASIERMVKQFKSHRNAADFAKSFIRDA